MTPPWPFFAKSVSKLKLRGFASILEPSSLDGHLQAAEPLEVKEKPPVPYPGTGGPRR